MNVELGNSFNFKLNNKAISEYFCGIIDAVSQTANHVVAWCLRDAKGCDEIIIAKNKAYLIYSFFMALYKILY
ncbi:MAG: hypothetical protein PHR39_08525 [Actinomycetota bacterium]|nr:hypothetical protein [Actinomycetota bacterium]